MWKQVNYEPYDVDYYMAIILLTCWNLHIIVVVIAGQLNLFSSVGVPL